MEMEVQSLNIKQLYFASFHEGVKGLTKLLRGARETNHQINTYQRFEKGGGFDAALKDFYSVNPTDVTRIHGRGRLVSFILFRFGGLILLSKQKRSV